MADVQQGIASFEANIERQTGKSVPTWVELVRSQQLERHGEILSWLKSVHGLSHSHANQIAKRTLQSVPANDGDELGHLFAGGRKALRPIYDRLAEALGSLGDDVSFAPKKANVSVRRRKQFALIQPSTRTRIDVGLILKDAHPPERFEPSGRFNPMFTHRVRIERADDVDQELLQWLKDAYDQAG